MIPILIIIITLYIISGNIYFSIIDKSYKEKLTQDEYKLYKFLNKFDKLYEPMYQFLSIKGKSQYKRNEKKAIKDANLYAFENRNTDWLSQQLRDESISFNEMTVMFDLQSIHHSNCQAQNLKNYHSNQCDANGIDTGSY